MCPIFDGFDSKLLTRYQKILSALLRRKYLQCMFIEIVTFIMKVLRACWENASFFLPFMAITINDGDKHVVIQEVLA